MGLGVLLFATFGFKVCGACGCWFELRILGFAVRGLELRDLKALEFFKFEVDNLHGVGIRFGFRGLGFRV